MVSGVGTWGDERGRPAPVRARVIETPRYTAGDIGLLLLRQIPLMVVVFLLVLALGVVFALRLKQSYPAHSSLLIKLSSAYVYQPRVGDAARGVAPDNDAVVQSELEILQSDAVRERVVRDIGVDRLFPKLAHEYDTAGPAKRVGIEQSAIKTISTNLKITSTPGNAIVRLSYSDPDPQNAALVLNTLVDEYLRYRRSVLSDRDTRPLDQQRRLFQDQLTDASLAYEKFLGDNGIGDFEAEKTSLAQIYSQLLTDSYSVQAQLSEVQGRLGVTARQAGSAQEEVGLYRDLDHTAQDKLAQLRSDRQDLLSRYQPTASPIHDIDQKIAAQQALIASGQATGAGAKRIGINPIYQTLVTEKNQLEAQAASLRDRKASLDGEIAQITTRRQKLTGLEPQYQQLFQRRDLLTTNVRALTQREQEAEAQQALAQNGDDAIRVIERAYPPSKGKSLRGPVLILSAAFAAFAALCAGLLGAFLARGYVSREAAERELEMPVLVAAPAK